MFRDINMILKFLLLLLLKGSECSIVVDSFDQKGIYLSDYCPNMEYCPEGAHVMCMYYNPDRIMGPRCSNPQNVTITPALANQLLDITNAIRSKIATGRETGLNGTRLPRGYGIFRLKWDNELATFAQVLANQCVLRHDLCRATKRFPDPGQAAGLVRFSYPDWNPISRMSSNPPPGLDDSKMAFTVTQTLKSWYMKKAFVTPEMIEQYPLIQNPAGKLYLESVHGPATHMGCGMSAYSEFAFYDTLYSMNYNSIQVICNFSARPKPGAMTYAIVPERGSTRCGCPVGTQEDSDCLCSEVEHKVEKPRVTDVGIQAEPEACPNSDNCEPTLVLLPIFTVEDAPPEKLIERAQNIREPLSNYVMQRLDNRSDITQKSHAMEISNFFGETIQQNSNDQLAQQDSDVLSRAPQQNSFKRNTMMPWNNYVRTKTKSAALQRRIPQTPKPTTHHALGKKSSIFTRVSKFNLPNEPIKTNVKPRKDFKNMERVVNDYFKYRDNKSVYETNKQITASKQQNTNTNTFSLSPTIEEQTKTISTTVEETVTDFDHTLEPTYNVTVQDLDVKYEESDEKLMNLLDTLEKEVKHIELNGNKKDIFDAKIRKIYGSVLGKSVDWLGPAKMKLRDKLKSKPLLLPPTPSSHAVNQEPDIFEKDFRESKFYPKHEFKHGFNDDLRNGLDSNRLSEGNRNNYDYDVEKKVDRDKKHDYINNYNDNIDKKLKMQAYDKNYDGLEDQSFNDEMISDNERNLFADIEQKYNERLEAYELNKLNQKLNENEDQKYIDKMEHKYNKIFDGEYNDIGRQNYPISKYRQQLNIGKKANLRKTILSNDENKHRVFNNYRRKQSNTYSNFEKIHFRNDKDDKKIGKEEIDRNYLFKEFEREDPLSAERRKYYQEKLEALKNQLRARSLHLKKHDVRTGERVTPRMRPNRKNMDKTIPKAHRSSLYVPDRARFLHGF